MSDALRKAVRAMVKNMVPVTNIWANVLSVDEDKLTMKVEDADDKLEIEDVLLNIDADNTGITIIPKKGSRVLIASVENRNTDYFLLMALEVDKVWFNGKAHGGILISQEVASKLNALENDVNNIKAVFGAWVPVPNDGGLALKTAAATWAGSALVPTQKEELENEHILHG